MDLKNYYLNEAKKITQSFFLQKIDENLSFVILFPTGLLF